MMSLLLFGRGVAAGDEPATTQPTTAVTVLPGRVDGVSLANYVPPSVVMFVEVVDLQELEEHSSQTDWGSAISSIVFGRADAPGSGDERLQPFAQLLGLPDATAVRHTIFGRRAAVALPRGARLSDGVLLAIPEDVGAIETALKQRDRPPTVIGRARQYTLDNQGHCLATDGRVILIGDNYVATSIYGQSVALLATPGPSCLAKSVAFQQEVAALSPKQYRALLYFDFVAPTTAPVTSQPGAATQTTTAPLATQPAVATSSPSAGESLPLALSRWLPGSWPRLLRGAIGLDVDGRMIGIGVRGQLNQPVPATVRPVQIDALSTLPASTLVAWVQAVDFAHQYDATIRGGPGLAKLYLTLVQARFTAAGTSFRDGLVAHLGGQTVFLLGLVTQTEQQQPAGFDLPAVGVVVPIDDRQAVSKAMDLVGSAMLAMFNLPAIRAKLKRPLEITRTTEGDVTIASLNIADFLRLQTDYPYAEAFRFAWAVSDHELVLSTHPAHVRQILRARAGQAPTLNTATASAIHLTPLPTGTYAVLLAQPSRIAAVFRQWLAYLEAHHPELTERSWWEQVHRRHAAQVSLGFRPGPPNARGVQVVETLVGWPAYGRLQAGDLIIAADGQRLEGDNPRAALRRLITQREDLQQIVLTVLRGGEEVDVTIDLPEPPPMFDPVGAMRQAEPLLAPFSIAAYRVWTRAPDRFHARLTLTAEVPTTQPAATAPATAPAPTTQPAPAPAPTTAPVVVPASQPAPPPTTTAPTTTTSAPTTQAANAP